MQINIAAPKYIQVAVQIRNYIESNSLATGTRLQGGRKLAKSYNVSHHTVYDALELLASEGIVEIRPDSGTYVTDNAHDILNNSSSVWDKLVKLGWQIGYDSESIDLFKKVGKQDYTYLSMCTLDKSFEYDKVVSECLHELADEGELNNIVVNYNYQGHEALRAELVNYLASHNITADKDDIILYPSSYIALETIIKSFFRAGMIVYMSDSVLSLQRQLLKSLGVEVVIIPNDEKGFSLENLKKVYRYGRQAIVAITTFNIWTDINVNSSERMNEMLEWCNDQHLPIIELDTDSTLIPNYNTLKSIDRHNSVLYVGSLPTYFSYGLNVAWSIASKVSTNRIADVLNQTNHFPLNINYHIVLKLLLKNRLKNYLDIYKSKLNDRIEFTKSLLNQYIINNATWEYSVYSGLFLIKLNDSGYVPCEKLNSEGIVCIKNGKSGVEKIHLMSCSLPENELEEVIKKLSQILNTCFVFSK